MFARVVALVELPPLACVFTTLPKYTMHQYAKIALDELEEDETIRLHPIEGACVPRDKQTIHLTK